MTGVYSEWQPQYAKHGTPTFPVRISINPATGKVNKKPAVPRFLKRTFERHWLDKHGDCNGIGFANGKLSGLFVADLDSTDPDIVREGERLFGESPLVWQTGSGKFAAAYKWTGQRRRIRRIPGLPIDLLGEGGFTAAPPSIGGHVPYRIIRGTLADLERLPEPRIPEEMLALEREPEREPDNILPVETAAGIDGLVPEGSRHQWLKSAFITEVWQYAAREDFLNRAMTIHAQLDTGSDPYTLEDTIKLANWYWNHREMGVLVRAGHRHWLCDAADLATLDRSALAIYVTLRRYHPTNEPFFVANGMHKKMRMETFFATKRKLLVDAGLIVLHRPRTHNTPDLYCWPVGTPTGVPILV